METETQTQKLVEVVKLLEQMNVTWMKIRIGSYQYWILSKEKPKQTRVAGAPVSIEGEIIPGWWLWTY